VTRWMKQVGDLVDRDEPLYEISTDKVDSEMPAPASGVLTEILVPEGDTVAVGERLAVISEGGDESSPPPAAVADPAEQRPAPSDQGGGAPPVAASTGAGAVTSPFVRRALAASGRSADDVVGTGPGGRISRADLAATASIDPTSTESAPIPATTWVPDRPAAVAFVAMEARYGEVEQALASKVAVAAAAEGVILDATVFALRAAIEALGEFPELNAWTTDGELHPEASRNVGIDVEIEQGLVAPVIHDAQDLTLRGLARRMVEVTERATTLSLGIEDLMGATFSVTRVPAEPVILSIPALRPPQVAALSVGGIRRTPVATSEGGDEVVVITSVGILGLAYDSAHVSPTLAAAFLARTAALLERPDWTAQL